MRWKEAMKLLRAAKSLDRKKDRFDVAEKQFFHWAMISNAGSAQSALNYALVKQCIREDFEVADKYYCKAMTLDPMDETIKANYRDFVEQLQEGGGIYHGVGPSYEVFNRSRVVGSAEVNGKVWEKCRDPEAGSGKMKV